VGVNNQFRGVASIGVGVNTLTVKANDASGNQSTRQYQIDANGASKTFTHNANGNMLSDGTRSFEWNAKNELVAITESGRRTEFTYDGWSRRVRTVVKEGALVVSDIAVVWCAETICEERVAETGAVRRLFPLGEQIGTASHFFVKDHVGSVRLVTNVSGTVVASYEFDPWGRRTLLQGADVTSVGFTGHQATEATDVWLSLYRAYDASTGRWLTPDPIGTTGGLNLYEYVVSNPVRFVDPLGLKIDCKSTVKYTYAVERTRCRGNPAGCTFGSMDAPKADPCRQDKRCGTWGFNGNVNLDIAVEFRVDSRWPSSDTPGATLQEHENLHVGDLKNWCDSVANKFPSEGFTSLEKCRQARNGFLSDVGADFSFALTATTENRDAK
jgi:RHS repeat-associated protein